MSTLRQPASWGWSAPSPSRQWPLPSLVSTRESPPAACTSSERTRQAVSQQIR
jgi:hypothetical protein